MVPLKFASCLRCSAVGFDMIPDATTCPLVYSTPFLHGLWPTMQMANNLTNCVLHTAGVTHQGRGCVEPC